MLNASCKTKTHFCNIKKIRCSGSCVVDLQESMHLVSTKQSKPVPIATLFCRNFPQGTIGDMIQDASQGISFVCNNIAAYGGDPNRFVIDSISPSKGYLSMGN